MSITQTTDQTPSVPHFYRDNGHYQIAIPACSRTKHLHIGALVDVEISKKGGSRCRLPVEIVKYDGFAPGGAWWIAEIRRDIDRADCKFRLGIGVGFNGRVGLYKSEPTNTERIEALETQIRGLKKRVAWLLKAERARRNENSAAEEEPF